MLGWGLSACSPSAAAPTLAPSAAAPLESPTPTLAPSATPLPGRLIAVGALDEPARDWLAAQAAQAGLGFDQRDQLAAADLPSETRVVVWYNPPGDLAALAGSAPQVQFAAVTSAPLEPGVNLTVIRSSPDRQAFAAGFLSVLLSTDWRSAGLIPSDQPTAATAFQNGGRYFCGDCAPGWPLGETYPKVSAAAASADGAGWAAEVNVLFDSGKAEVFYLSDPAYKPEVYAALQGRDQSGRTVVVFGSLPPPDELKAQWAATIGVDSLPALQRALPEMLVGKSAGALDAAIQLSSINPGLLSAGRQALFDQMLADLEKGGIQTGSIE
jgi:hypothetical protein